LSVHFDEIAVFELIGASRNLHTKHLESQRIFSPALLKSTKRVADSLTRILVLACFHNLLHKSVLLRRQADVSGRHIRLLLENGDKISTLAKLANAAMRAILSIKPYPGIADHLSPQVEFRLDELVRFDNRQLHQSAAAFFELLLEFGPGNPRLLP
jgi:hypothetical protein